MYVEPASIIEPNSRCNNQQKQNGEYIMNLLKVGDVVTYQGNFGQDIPKKAKVVAIAINAKNKDIEVENINWSNVKNRDVIISLDNGSWAYGYQVSPTSRSRRIQFKADVESELERRFLLAKGNILKAMNSGCIDVDAEEDSPFNVLAVTSALIQDQSEELKTLGSSDMRRKLRKEVDNIIKFL
jgi:tartrate dehydratase beta subunit/fumarate hydratase class I family protein